MTKQRALKRLVRERMARTGETYTTAHRIVTSSRAGDDAPASTSTYPEGTYAGHRESALVKRLLAAAGVDLSEAMVCGLGGGIGFMYAVFEYEAVPHPLLTFVAQHHPRPWVEEVADNLGLELSSVTSSSPAAGFRKLDAALDAGRPALVTVGRAELPWHDDVSELEAMDPYRVVVEGRDESGYAAFDPGEGEHRLSRAGLERAWSVHRKGRFAVQTVASAASPRPLREAVEQAIATTAAHMTGPVLDNAFDVNFGLSGIGRWAAEVEDRRSKKGWRARFGSGEAFAHAVRRIVECFTWSYSAPGATRPIYADFLAEAARSTSLDLAPAAAAARASGELWSRLVDVAAVAEEGDAEATLSQIAEIARELLAAEERLVERLRAAS